MAEQINLNLYKITIYNGDEDNFSTVDEFVVAESQEEIESIAKQLVEYYLDGNYSEDDYEIEEIHALGGYEILLGDKVEDDALERIEKEIVEFEKHKNEPIIERKPMSFVISPMTTIELIDRDTGKVVRSEEIPSENVSVDLETREVNIKGFSL